MKITGLLEQRIHNVHCSLCSVVMNRQCFKQQAIKHDDDLSIYDTGLNLLRSVSGITPDSQRCEQKEVLCLCGRTIRTTELLVLHIGFFCLSSIYSLQVDLIQTLRLR